MRNPLNPRNLRAAIIGGNLQGVEATYLAHKAGWKVLVIDRKPAPPASGLCDSFIQLEIIHPKQLDTILQDVDLVIPAVENHETLHCLVEWSQTAPVPLAFDPDAYEISSSKLESDRLFARIGVPAPLPWPACGFPLIAKPSFGSGSEGVRFFRNRRQLEECFPSLPPHDWVLQEYLDGPSYSLEVIGEPGHYSTIQVTGLEMDAGYDCKRVLAPTQLSLEQVTQLEKISLTIAEALRLKGLMDVEAILHQGRLKVLEIDARLPSQTPAAVYWSTGINMLEMLARLFLEKQAPGKLLPPAGQNPFVKGFRHLPKLFIIPARGVVYEHILVSRDTLEVCGEHIMTTGGPLHLLTDFFGAEEAITDYVPGSQRWVATLIIPGDSPGSAREKRNRVIENLRDHFKINHYLDPFPKTYCIRRK